jgi:hypothetical protein
MTIRMLLNILVVSAGVVAALVLSPVVSASGLDVDPPAAVEDLEIQFTACDDLRITWKGLADAAGPDASGLKHYRVLREKALYTWQNIASTRATPDTIAGTKREIIVDTSAWPEDTIKIAVGATDNAGNNGPLVTATIDRPTWSCLDPLPPTKPTLTVTAINGDCSAPQILPEAVDQGGWYTSGIAKYHFYRDGHEISGGAPLGIIDHYGWIPGETHFYQAAAEDGYGNVSEKSDAVAYATSADCNYSQQSDYVTVKVLMAYFTDAPAPTLTETELEEIVFGNADRSNHNLAEYIEEISYGKSLLVKASVHGFVPLEKTGEDYGCIRNNYGGWVYCNGPQLRGDIRRLHGVDYDSATRFIYFVGGMSDKNADINSALLGANFEAVDLADSLAHEFLHTYGGNHSGARKAETCEGHEHVSPYPNDPNFGCDQSAYAYGDGYSALGTGNMFHPPVMLKQRMGFLAPEETVTLTSDATNMLLLAADDTANGVKQILIKRWQEGRPIIHSIEHRIPRGYNGEKGATGGRSPIDGLLIRHLPPAYLNNGPHTLLVETLDVDGSQSFYDPALDYGVRWTRPSPDVNYALVTTCGISSACDESWKN